MNGGVSFEQKFNALLSNEIKRFYCDGKEKTVKYTLQGIYDPNTELTVFLGTTSAGQKKNRYSYQMLVHPSDESIINLFKDFFCVRNKEGKKGPGVISFQANYLQANWKLQFFQEMDVLLGYSGDPVFCVYSPFSKKRCLIS